VSTQWNLPDDESWLSAGRYEHHGPDEHSPIEHAYRADLHVPESFGPIARMFLPARNCAADFERAIEHHDQQIRLALGPSQLPASLDRSGALQPEVCAGCGLAAGHWLNILADLKGPPAQRLCPWCDELRILAPVPAGKPPAPPPAPGRGPVPVIVRVILLAWLLIALWTLARAMVHG
jgi:hypothetical protein